MSTTPPPSDLDFAELLQEVVGYLNFSGGLSDDRFLANINQLFFRIEREANHEEHCIATRLCPALSERIAAQAARE